MVGRLRRIERGALNSKERLHSPTNAPVASIVGGVGWQGGSRAGKWARRPYDSTSRNNFGARLHH